MKERYSFRIYCYHCKDKIIDSDEITKKGTQTIYHKCSFSEFEIGISKFKDNKFIGD